jgi:hypothetical protein
VALVATSAAQGAGGCDCDEGRARRGLRGSVVYMMVRASFDDQLLQSGGPSMASFDDQLLQSSDDLLQSLIYACDCWLSPY